MLVRGFYRLSGLDMWFANWQPMRRVLGAESLTKSAGVDITSKADMDSAGANKTDEGYVASLLARADCKIAAQQLSLLN